jgi:Protein of unknown function (DUF2465)
MCYTLSIFLSRTLELSLSALELLEFLVSELQTARLCGWQADRPAQRSEAVELNRMCGALRLDEVLPQAGMASLALLADSPVSSSSSSASASVGSSSACSSVAVRQMEAVYTRASALQAELSESGEHPGSLLFSPSSPTEWSAPQLALVGEIVDALALEYSTRRRVLLKRLDVTLQTFLWGERAAEHARDIHRQVLQRRQGMEYMQCYSLRDALSARSHLLSVQKVSTRHGSTLKRHVIDGAVPDRGGRVAEKAASGDMPAFAPRVGNSAHSRAQGGRGGYASRGGGRRRQHRGVQARAGDRELPQSRAREVDSAGPRPQRKRANRSRRYADTRKETGGGSDGSSVSAVGVGSSSAAAAASASSSSSSATSSSTAPSASSASGDAPNPGSSAGSHGGGRRSGRGANHRRNRGPRSAK